MWAVSSELENIFPLNKEQTDWHRQEISFVQLSEASCRSKLAQLAVKHLILYFRSKCNSFACKVCNVTFIHSPSMFFFLGSCFPHIGPSNCLSDRFESLYCLAAKLHHELPHEPMFCRSPFSKVGPLRVHARVFQKITSFLISSV